MDKPVMYMVLSSSHIHSHDEKWIDQRSIYDLSDIHSKLADENKETTLHHQSDMTILSLAVLEQNTQKNAASWINDLVASSNPRLGQSSILFRIKEPFELYPC
jgi:hypothetical protein